MNVTTIEQTQPNTDLLGETTDAHPVGTGVGIAGGAIAGGVIGTVAGPVGTAIGAAIGAIAGGLAGKAVSEAINPSAPSDVAVLDAHTQELHALVTSFALTHEAIARVAYDIWERKGRFDGHALDDWLEAETFLNSVAMAA